MIWKPIETAPLWTLVIVYQKEAPITKSCKNGVFTAVKTEKGWITFTPSYGKRKVGKEFLDPDPTHWMSLPQEPKD